MTNLSEQRLQALGHQLTSIEHDVATLHKALRDPDIITLIGDLRAFAELSRQVCDIAACLIDGTQPELTDGVQARLVRHQQEKP